MKIRYVIVLLILLTGISPARAQFELESAFPNLQFLYWPVDLQNAGDGSGRLFVIETDGLIGVFPNNKNVTTMSVFLDIKDKVVWGTPYGEFGESGLISLAFHPDYETNGYFYVNYLASDGNQSINIIARYTVSSSDSNKADPDSEYIIAAIPQYLYYGKHAGQIAFGPDGYLYIATGDNEDESTGTFNNAQDLQGPWGKILRLDVDNPPTGQPYGIPQDNPYRGNSSGYLEQIFALGFRNPRKICFDHQNGNFWVADAGWLRREEINLVEKGRNYGWNVVEGSLCFTPYSGCSTNGLTAPAYEYEDPEQDNTREILGGVVYHGVKVPELDGAYIYTDRMLGTLYRFIFRPGGAPDNQQIADFDEFLALDSDISAFGVDEQGEVYFLDIATGKIYTFKTTVTAVEDVNAVPSSFALKQNYPNPFNPSTTIEYSLDRDADVEISIFDISGRLVRNLVSKRVSPGEHSVVWDGRNGSGIPMASGIYLYRLKSAGRVIETKRMALLK